MAEWMYRYTNGQTVRPKTALADAAKQWDFATTDALARTISAGTSTSSNASAPGHSMDATRGSISSASTQSTRDESAASPFILCHGRRFLRDLPYPLPCDLPELQRQNLQTLLSISTIGTALGSPPSFLTRPPTKVLETACGSGYWSSLCHEHLEAAGHKGVSFTGLDVVDLAGNLERQGVDWKFVQHDVRKVPLPFDDEEFDIVVMKDMGLVVPMGALQQRIMEEITRVLKSGGTLEIWEKDHIIRSIVPHPPLPPGTDPVEEKQAIATGTFLISPGTPFTETQNKFLQDSNGWIQKAFDRRKLAPTPCTLISQMLLQEPDTLSDVAYKRIAIPLGELRWEREAAERNPTKRRESETAKGKRSIADSGALTEEQAALRYTALLVAIQMIESLEPLLLEVSGKNQEEWQRWWGWMMADLLEGRNASNGECLEIGVWWAHKI